MATWRWQGTDLILTVRVQPRAVRNELKVEADGRLRLRITAPPVAGQANEHLRCFLSHLFGVARSQISVTAGETSRNKRILIRGANPQKARAMGLNDQE